MLRKWFQLCIPCIPTEYNSLLQILSGAVIPIEARVLIMNQQTKHTIRRFYIQAEKNRAIGRSKKGLPSQ